VKTVYLDASVIPGGKAQLSSVNTICSVLQTPFFSVLSLLYASVTMGDFGVGAMGKWCDRTDHQILNQQGLSSLLNESSLQADSSACEL